jgi:hypothetical protein
VSRIGGAEAPTAAVALYAVNADGSLTPISSNPPSGDPLVLHDRRGGPEGITFSPAG